MAFIFAVASTGLAGGINEAVGHPLTSREEAERLTVGSRVTLAYATCKTMWITEVDKEKGIVVPAEANVLFIYKGKLYACAAPDALKEFRSNIDENIRKADENWRQFHFEWHGHPVF